MGAGKRREEVVGRGGGDENAEAEEGWGVFNHSFSKAVACMSAVFAAHLIIYPNAAYPLN